jgi:hypothetical protein
MHEHRLAEAVDGIDALARGGGGAAPDLPGLGLRLFEACVPAIPYAAATAFLAGEKRRLNRTDGESPRVALVADGLDAMHGVSAAVRQIRERGARGFEVEVVGTDAMCDRRLSAVASIDVPFYDGLRLGVPALPAIVETLSEGRYDLVHICTPGPAGIMASLIAHTLGMALVGSYHTELASYAGVRSGRPELEFIASAGLRMFYGACELVLSPSQPATSGSTSLGSAPSGWLVGTAASTSPASGPRYGRPDTCREPSTSSTPGGWRGRRASTCSPTPS